jgi:hypothetical protein
MAFGIWFVNMAFASIYTMCKIGLEVERYGLKNSIANITNLAVH